MKRYDNYKDSGVAWLGEVPSHWEVCKVKNKYKIQTGFTPATKEDSYYDDENGYTWVTIGDLCQDPIRSSQKKISRKYLDQYHQAKTPAGSLLYSFKLSVGAVAFAGIDLYTNEAIASFLGDNNVNLKFLKYSSQLIANNCNHNTYGAPIMNQELILNAPIVFPPLAEQEAIAAYLDAKCEAIDGMVEKIEEKISLFQRLRRAIITRVVTRGLNPDAPLRPSGVDWIGEVPEHWEVTRIRNIIHKSKNGIKIGPFGSALTGNVHGDLPYKVYGQWNITGRDFKAGSGTIDETTFCKLVNYEVVSGDILVSMMGTVGKCCVVPTGIQKGIMDSHVVKVRLDDRVYNSRYFEYIYDRDNSQFVMTQINVNKKGSIMDGLNSSIIKNLYVTVPPLAEQQAIADYLDRKCSKIDELVAKYEKQKELLARYKKSLIAQVVTGQRRVC